MFAAIDLGNALPAIIGLGFAAVVVLASLLLFRGKPVAPCQTPARAKEPATDTAPPTPSGVIQGRNPFWGLAVPALGVLVVGGVVVGVVVPFVRDLYTAQDKFDKEIRSSKPWTFQVPPSQPIPTTQLVPLQQPITIPNFKPTITPPPMPRIPQTTIDRRGFVRVR